MIKALENLTEEECDLMYRTPALVAVLIAGADSNIDNSEIKEAISLTNLKKVTARDILLDYYDKVRELFEQQLSVFIAQYPENTEYRQHFIIDELSKLNKILPKLEYKFAVQFYASMRDFAKKIAQSSGGVLGFIPVGYEESKLVELPMIKLLDPKA